MSYDGYPASGLSLWKSDICILSFSCVGFLPVCLGKRGELRGVYLAVASVFQVIDWSVNQANSTVLLDQEHPYFIEVLSKQIALIPVKEK